MESIPTPPSPPSARVADMLMSAIPIFPVACELGQGQSYSETGYEHNLT